MAAKRRSESTQEPGERPLGVFGYFVHEALRRLWVYRRTSLVAVGMIAIALMTLGSFLLISENLNHAVDLWQGRSHLSIFFTREATPEQIAGVRAYLSSHRELASFSFVSKEEAYAKFRKHFAQLGPVLNELDQNPFPASFDVQISQEAVSAPAFKHRLDEMRALQGVDDIQVDWEWVGKLRRLANVLSFIGLVAGGILAIAAAFTIANVIRLTMLLYREEIDIMRLVGATETTIRGPFMLEGFLQGMLGGVIAVSMLYGLFHGARYLAAGPTAALLWDFLFTTFLPWPKTLALVGGGVFAGLLGSWLSMRETSEE